MILVLITNSFYNFTKLNSVENKEEYAIGPRGSSCSEGTQIMDKVSCREACRALNLPQAEILGNQKCFMKDSSGKCYQNGRQGSAARLICKKSGQTRGRY